jgi:hypothetical protein
MEAKNLPNVNIGGGCDPYCTLSVGGEVSSSLSFLFLLLPLFSPFSFFPIHPLFVAGPFKCDFLLCILQIYRTRTIWDTLNPFWAEDFETPLYQYDKESHCLIAIWDEEKVCPRHHSFPFHHFSLQVLADRIIGGLSLRLGDFTFGETTEKWYPIGPLAESHYISGEIQVIVSKLTDDRGRKDENSFHLRVGVVQGRNLPSKDLNGLSDPFVKFTIAGQKKKTKVWFVFIFVGYYI